jgi:general stress protein YciG
MANQGGNREQHKRAGQQSHKNDDMGRDQQGGAGMDRSGQQRADDEKSGQQGGQRGGSGNFANDPQRASEAGRKGGQS